MARSVVETILGAIVLIAALGFLGWAYARSDVSTTGGYELVARFDRVDGLDTGADVRISGIKVGKVTAMSLDPVTFRAEVRFSVASDIEVPSDSSASVASASLLGGKYLSIVPGGDTEILKPGGEITLTQSSVNLEELLGKFIFSSSPSGSGPASSGTGPAAP
jgi:phospholipid/cholesterol/gamma-HCH transport system substrate-binding protein